MHSPKGTCLDIFVDNTSCKAALNRRLSSEGVSKELKEIIRDTEKRGICVEARYVSTLNNPADHISRGKEVDIKQIEKCVM